VGFLVEVLQDALVEGGEHVEFGGGEQVDEMPPDAVHVLGGRVLDGAAGSRQITELREPPQALTNQRQPTYLPEK
jgi:hypothetical protein